MLTPREQIEELEETVRQQVELLAPTVSLKSIGLSPQESRFVMCLLSSPTRIRTDAQLIGAVAGVKNEKFTGSHLKVLRSTITRKMGDKIVIHRRREVGYELAEPSAAWLKTVVDNLSVNGHNTYALKNILQAHVGRKRPLSFWNHTYPGALPYSLTPVMILVVEQLLHGPVSLEDIERNTGMERKASRTQMHHLWSRCLPRQFVLRHGSTKNRTYEIDPNYRHELIGGFRQWFQKFESMYDLQ